MRRWLLLAGAAVLGGCGGNPTAPTPDFVGSYSFVVEASSVCEMPAERFEWNVIGTAVAGGQDDDSTQFRMTLPGGDPTLSLILNYASRQGGRRGRSQGGPTLSVSIAAQNVPMGETLEVSVSGSPQATAVEAADGRGQISDGTINGSIRVIELTQQPRTRTEIGRCTAADHRFTLTPR